jgi:hypothetical protein
LHEAFADDDVTQLGLIALLRSIPVNEGVLVKPNAVLALGDSSGGFTRAIEAAS